MAMKRDFSAIQADQDGDSGEQPPAKRLIELQPHQASGLLPMASAFPSFSQAANLFLPPNLGAFTQPPNLMFAPPPPLPHHPQQQGFVPFQRKNNLPIEGGGDSGTGSDDSSTTRKLTGNMLMMMGNQENGDEEEVEEEEEETNYGEEDGESEGLFELEVAARAAEGDMVEHEGGSMKSQLQSVPRPRGQAISTMQSTSGAYYQPAPPPLNGDAVVANVAGRLRLLNDAHKFQVTIGELHRRINLPECLNTSILGAIMRRAKSKEGGKDLTDMLLAHGIYIPSGRRKNVPNTSFTCLIEEEARQLADDLNAVYEREWHAAQFAQEKARRALAAGADPSILHHRALIGAKAIEDLLAFFHGCQYEYESDQATAHPDFRHYALITHEFGWRAHCAALEAQRRMMLEEARLYAALIATGHHQQQKSAAAAASVQNSTMGEPQDQQNPQTK